ncbi:heterokaryon incompatibility protein-domain-containing protein [Xylogone sp. PMI_703]|nr:heterokaryon incompatibility protein-domain-containing protein [Xylogone sp. PMI_703]
MATAARQLSSSLLRAFYRSRKAILLRKTPLLTKKLESLRGYSASTFTSSNIKMESEPEPAICEWVDRETKIHCFRLSETNKRALLRSAALAAEERLPKNKAFLERLHQLSPEFASHFSLRDTGVSEAPFRLLVKEDSKLVTDPFYQVQSYIVLSYCWHNDEWSLAPNLNKGWWPISDRMMKVLQSNCEADEGIWIDQLCIHQDDLGEKRLAVSAMDQVYKSARSMYVAIEDIELSKKDQDAALAFVSQKPLEPKDAAGIVLKIASARWFSRAWCSYELKTTKYSAGKEPILIIGLQGVDSSVWQVGVMGFYPNIPAQDYIMRASRDEKDSETSLYLQYLGFLNPVGRILKDEEEGNLQQIVNLSIQVLHMMEQLGCTFMTDYIPIMMNTSGLDIVFNGSVHSKEELYWFISTLSLAAGDPAVLTATGPHLHLPSKDDGQEVTSWIQSFTSKDWTIDARIPPDNLNINRISEESIDLDLFVINNDPIPPSAAAIECGVAFVQDCYESNCPTLSPYYSETTIGTPRTIIRLGHNVATILDLGLDWISSAWPLLQDHVMNTEFRWKIIATPDPTICDPIQKHLLPYLLAAQHRPLPENALTSDAEKYRDLLQSFLSFFLSPTVRGNVLTPGILRTGPNPTDFALFDPNSLTGDSNLPIVKYAIPVSMSTSPFQRSMRVWVLEELADEGHIPTAGRPGMSFIINQAARYGGKVTKEPLEDNLWKVEVKAGGITDDIWKELGAAMMRNNMNEWIEEKIGGEEALTRLNCESGCWRLLEKGVLWGCPDVKPDGKVVTLKKGQRVYGTAKPPSAQAEENQSKSIEEGVKQIAEDEIVNEQSTDQKPPDSNEAEAELLEDEPEQSIVEHGVDDTQEGLHESAEKEEVEIEGQMNKPEESSHDDMTIIDQEEDAQEESREGRVYTIILGV